MADTEQIYVELLDEGVQVWAPAVAEKLADDLYQLPEVSPGDQTWAFAPGSVVRCEIQATGLVAVEVVRPYRSGRVPPNTGYVLSPIS